MDDRNNASDGSNLRRPQVRSVRGQCPGGGVEFHLREEQLVIRYFRWDAFEPTLRLQRTDVVALRTESAGRMVDGRPAASLWLGLRAGSPAIRLVKRGPADDLEKLADDATVLLGLRPPLAKSLTDSKPPAPGGWQRRPNLPDGQAVVKVAAMPSGWLSSGPSGGKFTAGPHGLCFQPDDRHDPGHFWPRAELFGVEAHCIVNNRSPKWELSIRLRDGKRQSLLQGHDEPVLRQVAQELNSALAVPTARERVTRALAAISKVPRYGSQALPEESAPVSQETRARVIPYAPAPTDDAIYQPGEEGLRIILPRVGWAKVPSANGFVSGVFLLSATAVLISLFIYGARRIVPPPLFLTPLAAFGTYGVLRSIYACLIRSMIEIDAEAVQVHIERPWLAGATRRWTCDQIIDVRAEGFPSRVALELSSGDTVTVVATPRVADARAYVQRMREALGLPR